MFNNNLNSSNPCILVITVKEYVLSRTLNRYLGQRCSAFAVLPQAWRVNVLEDGRKGPTGAVGARTVMTCWATHISPYRQTGNNQSQRVREACVNHVSWDNFKYCTSLLEFAVTVVTHFSHAVLQVLQRVAVSGTAPAHYLYSRTGRNQHIQHTERHRAYRCVCVCVW